MAERGAAGQSERRHPAAHEIGTEPSYQAPLLFLGPVSLVARQRVVAGQPYTSDRCAAELSGRQAQTDRRRGRGSESVAAIAGADRAFPPCDGAALNCPESRSTT